MTRSATSPITALLQDAPLTLGIALMAVIASVYSWAGNDISGLLLTYSADALEPWRYVTSVLPHVTVPHLLLNLAGLLYFGFILERGLGSGRLAAIVLFLAAGSSAAQFALHIGGAGFSGVNYGLFGLLWLLSRRDPRFRAPGNPAPALLTLLFVALFFIGIVMTVTGVLIVANVAHAAGAILGGLLGILITAPLERKARWASFLAGCFGLFIIGAVVARPYINYTPARVLDLARQAHGALSDEDYERIIELYRRIVELEPNVGDHWHNLGYACMEMGRFAEAAAALERAVELQPCDQASQTLLARSRAWARARDAYHAYFEDDFGRSAAFYHEAIDYDASVPEFWHGLGLAFSALARFEEAAKAFRRALDLEPTDEYYRQAAEWAEAQHLAHLAHDLLVAEDYERSVVFYRRALRAADHVPQWWYNLGLALLRLDRFNEAHRALTRALILDPEGTDAAELLAWIEAVEGGGE